MMWGFEMTGDSRVRGVKEMGLFVLVVLALWYSMVLFEQPMSFSVALLDTMGFLGAIQLSRVLCRIFGLSLFKKLEGEQKRPEKIREI